MPGSGTPPLWAEEVVSKDPLKVKLSSVHASSTFTPSLGKQLVTVLGSAPVQTVIYGSRNFPGMQEDMYAVQTNAFLDALCTSLENGQYEAILPSLAVIAKNTGSLGSKYDSKMCNSAINPDKLLEIINSPGNLSQCVCVVVLLYCCIVVLLHCCIVCSLSQQTGGPNVDTLSNLLGTFAMNVLVPMASRCAARDRALKMWRGALSALENAKGQDVRAMSVAAVGLMRTVDQISRMINDISTKARLLQVERVCRYSLSR